MRFDISKILLIDIKKTADFCCSQMSTKNRPKNMIVAIISSEKSGTSN